MARRLHRPHQLSPLISMNIQRLLVFPCVIDSARPVVRMAQSLGFEIIGASSVSYWASGEGWDRYIHLPFITDSSFDDRFLAALEEHGITHVHAPHHGVWWHLNKLRKKDGNSFFLCTPHPFESHWEAFAPSQAWAEKQVDAPLAEALPKPQNGLAPPLTVSQLAGLHRNFLHTPGETDEDKLSGLCSIARLLPIGDVIEIGSLFGRSALALAWLARHYRIGSTLCVDPWSQNDLTDQGPDAKILHDEPQFLNSDKIFLNFLATAASSPGTSYIKASSEVAIHNYIRSAGAGYHNAEGLDPIPISGQIALLHIDGNHRYDHVCADIRNWTPYLADHAWLLLDDYIWSFGDGPRQAGDEQLETGEYDYAFVLSDTLFLRKATS